MMAIVAFSMLGTGLARIGYFAGQKSLGYIFDIP
jgi:hypothetical protein